MHCPTQNRCTLLLEMRILVGRILRRKTASHFCWKCAFFVVAFFDAKPLHTFAGNALKYISGAEQAPVVQSPATKNSQRPSGDMPTR